MNETIWFDVTNSPHVFFLEPFMKYFKKKGFNVHVTTRQFYRLDEILNNRGIEYHSVGRHFGKNLAAKAVGMAERVTALTLHIKKIKPIACIAAGSPYAMAASKLLRIPSFWITDNDISAHMVNFGARFATRVFLPEYSHINFYEKHGVKKSHIVTFKGLKEDFYLHGFKPDKNYFKKIGLSGKIAVIRSEPSHAVYFHGEKQNEAAIIETLQENGFSVIYLPRSKDEEQKTRAAFPNVFVPETALDGQNLLANSEILIGAGGSMNREAVVLGTKVLSTYSGPSLGVDEWLIKEKYMIHNVNPSKIDLKQFITTKLNKYNSTEKGFKTVASEIESVIQA